MGPADRVGGILSTVMPLPSIARRVRWWAGKPAGLVVSVRAYRWARSQLRDVKRRLSIEGVRTRVAPPSALAPRGHRGLRLALRTVSPTCLERALVLQAWTAAHADPPDVVIGVRKGESEVEAHAWLDSSDDPWFDPSYEELTRLRFAEN